MLKGSKCTNRVIGPSGYALTLASLPAFKGTRWVARRKAEIVIAVGNGIITLAEAREHYAISADEFVEWERAFTQRGVAGLHTLSQLKNLTN